MSEPADRFERIAMMIGRAGLDALSDAHVTVVGLGAVGGYAAEALARAGVGRLRLVDFDTVQPSNLNRQLLATTETIGRPKAELAAERVRSIHPACCVEPLAVFCHEETLETVLAGRPDVVIDAIDSLAPKVALLAGGSRLGLSIVSSMGAALRTDPAKLRVGPLSETRNCPLARQVRKRLRGLGVEPSMTCVYSIERSDHLRASAVGEAGGGDTLRRGRPRRPLGSLPTLPGMFGLAAANEAIRLVVGAFPRADDSHE